MNAINVPHVLAIWTPSPAELIVIMVIALLLFGKRLPEVARNLGKGVVEFKKGLKGVEDDIDQGNYQQPRPNSQSIPYGSDAASKAPAQPSSSPGEGEPKT